MQLLIDFNTDFQDDTIAALKFVNPGGLKNILNKHNLNSICH